MDNIFVRMPLEKLLGAIKESTSIADVFNKLNICKSSEMYKTFKQSVSYLGIELKFTAPIIKNTNRTPNDLLFVLSDKDRGRSVRTRVIKDNLIPYSCCLCKNSGEWMGSKLSLQLDHINGNNKDNRLENLRFLCPNCHTQTSTYGAKKLKINKEKNCASCDVLFVGKTNLCYPCYNKFRAKEMEKYDWPTKEVMESRVWSYPVGIVAKEIGCSTIAVKKHCKRLGIVMPQHGYWHRMAAGHGHDKAINPEVKNKIEGKQKRSLTQTEVEKVLELHKTGKSCRKIAKELGLGRFSVNDAVNKHTKTMERCAGHDPATELWKSPILPIKLAPQ